MKEQASWIYAELKKDLCFFSVVMWGENLENKTLNLIQKCRLKTLDSLQLASACLAHADIFVTSDQKFFRTGKKEFHSIQFI